MVWCEDILADCPNCGREVKCVRYNDDDFATGNCDCGTDFTIHLEIAVYTDFTAPKII